MSVFSDDSEQSTDFKTHPNQHTPRSWAEYQKLRKENPSQYYRPSVQAKMHSDAAKLGTEAFFKSAKAKNWWEE
jgi:hypothetical protein